MVKSQRNRGGQHILCLLLVAATLLLGGCASGTKVTINRVFKPSPEEGVVYVVPFESVLVPESFKERVFNTFVDDLNGNLAGTGVSWFYIVKEDGSDINPAWLANQVHITGDIWSYREETGCCSAEIKVKARVRVFEGGKPAPSMELVVPMESFFEYDKSTLAAERDQLALRLADEIASRILTAFANPR